MKKNRVIKRQLYDNNNNKQQHTIDGQATFNDASEVNGIY